MQLSVNMSVLTENSSIFAVQRSNSIFKCKKKKKSPIEIKCDEYTVNMEMVYKAGRCLLIKSCNRVNSVLRDNRQLIISDFEEKYLSLSHLAQW